MATAMSVGSAAANATATADGGNGSQRSIFGSGIALARPMGTSGNATANALSAGGLITNLEGARDFSGQRTQPRVGPAGIALDPMDATSESGLEAAAFTTGLPTDARALIMFAGNGNIKNHFNIANDSRRRRLSDIFGLATFGGSNTEGGSAANGSLQALPPTRLILTALVNAGQQLLVGLLDTNTEGNGLLSLTFQITREGVMVVDQMFSTVADAVNFLDGKVLGLRYNGPLNVSGNLDLVFTTTLMTNDVGAGFYFDLVFGNSTINAGRPPGDYDGNGRVETA